MGLFRAQAQAKHVERRSSMRYRVNCPAQLSMPMGNREGRIHDISLDGARFTTSNPPPSGTSGLLEWGPYEAFGKIIWSNEDGCGIEFERAITRAQIEPFVVQNDETAGPTANFGKIPVAPRGRRGLVTRD